VHKKLLYLESSGILRGYLPKEDSTFLPDLQRIPFTGFTGQEHTAQPAAGKQWADDPRCSIAEGVFRQKTLEGETFERLL